MVRDYFASHAFGSVRWFPALGGRSPLRIRLTISATALSPWGPSFLHANSAAPVRLVDPQARIMLLLGDPFGPEINAGLPGVVVRGPSESHTDIPVALARGVLPSAQAVPLPLCGHDIKYLHPISEVRYTLVFVPPEDERCIEHD